MKKILVTGPIASGKSVVCSRLRERGFSVYDSDSRAKALYDEIPGLKRRIEDALGIPFSQIGIIFSDEGKRTALQDILYPLVLEDMKRWADAAEGDRIFFESAVADLSPVFEGFFDEVWTVRSPFEVRAARNPKVLQRDHLQSLPRHSDVVIDNDSTIEELKRKTDNLL